MLQPDGTVTPLNNVQNYVLSEQQAGEILAQVIGIVNTSRQRNRYDNWMKGFKVSLSLKVLFCFSLYFPGSCTAAAAATEETSVCLQTCCTLPFRLAASGDGNPRLCHHALADPHSSSSGRQLQHSQPAAVQAAPSVARRGPRLFGKAGCPGERCPETGVEVGPQCPG